MKPATFARPALVPLPPPDAPLLSIEDAACCLRMTPLALRKILYGRSDAADIELGDTLRGMLVRLSPRRAYFKGRPFRAWLAKLAGESSSSPEEVAAQESAGLASVSS